jgi:ceramide glucosyltransferase
MEFVRNGLSPHALIPLAHLVQLSFINHYPLWSLGALFTLGWIATLSALRQMRHGHDRNRRLESEPYISFPVSILKPLKDLEDGIEESLESFFTLDYPCYEILFSVRDPEDPVCAVVQSLMDQYPDVDARLIIGRAEVGQNPKVNNLILGYRLAQHDFILICDSSIRADRYFLRRMASYMESNVGLVTALVAGENGEGLGGVLETVSLNTYYLKWTYLARSLKLPFFAGKVMLFRRSVADKFGGLSALGGFLAEDYLLAKSIRNLGLKVAIQAEPVVQEVGYREFKDYWSRHLRWGRIRKSIAPVAFFLEPIAGPAFWTLVLFAVLDSSRAVNSALILWGAWGLGDFLLLGITANGLSIETVIGWLLRELLVIPLWAHTLAGNTVCWKGTRLKLGHDTRLLEPRRPRHSRAGWLSPVRR